MNRTFAIAGWCWLLTVFAVVAAGCRDPAPPPPADEAPTGSAVTTPPEGPGLPSGWGHLTHRQLNREQLEMSQRARREVALVQNALAAELKAAVTREGLAGAVAVCAELAPDLARRASEEPGMTLGRTSWARRNADNAPPVWAAGLVAERVNDERYVAGPNGKLGYLKPIWMKRQCTRCHGTDEERDPVVDPVLAELYPDDQAVGFEAGDLRGWFWVELTSAGVR